MQQQIGCRTLGTDGHKPTHKSDQAAHSMALSTVHLFLAKASTPCHEIDIVPSILGTSWVIIQACARLWHDFNLGFEET